MARPQAASDAKILQAAHRVMVRRGAEGFTLAEVAREVGISRSAIIQRFESTRSLKITLTISMVDQFRKLLDCLPVCRSGDGLLALMSHMGNLIGPREKLGLFMQNYQADFDDPEMVALEHEREELMRRAISLRLPAVKIDHESAVDCFLANMGGLLIQWQLLSDDDAATFLVERTKVWLTLAEIPFTESVAENGVEHAVGE